MWDRQARFTAIVRATSNDLYRYAFWLCRNGAEAEDLVQETYARAWRSLDALREDKAAKQWLFTTLRRERARQFERTQPQMVDVDWDDLADGHVEYDTRTEAFALRVALAQLDEEYREPLVLQVVGGLSGEEIATLLGLTPAAVMTRLFRARQKLKGMLTEGDTGKQCEAMR